MTDNLLNRINTVEEAGEDDYLFYSLDKGIFSLPVVDFPTFSQQWCSHTMVPPLTMDLARAKLHSVILDLDFKSSSPSPPLDDTTSSSCYPHQSMLDLIDANLKMTLLPSVGHFTYIVTARSGSAGIHVHLPEFAIGYDDYILLCESLQLSFKLKTIERTEGVTEVTGEYTLDILQNAMLTGAKKPKTSSAYRPILLAYVDERQTVTYDFLLQQRSTSSSSSSSSSSHRYRQQMETIKKTLRKRKETNNSLFRKLTVVDEARFYLYMKHALMPVAAAFRPIYTLSYATVLSNQPSESPDIRDVATFTSRRDGGDNKKDFFLCKGKQLLFNSKTHVLNAFHYLKRNAHTMKDFKTKNHALDLWYRRIVREATLSMPAVDIPDELKDVTDTLRMRHAVFARDPHPLKTILEYDRGYYFLPAFYALCNHLKLSSTKLVKLLYRVLVDDKDFFHPLLERVGNVDEKIMELIVSDFTVDTLHFCADNLYGRPRAMRVKLEKIIGDNESAFLSVTTQRQMARLLRNLQEHHFPVRMLKIKSSLKKPARHIWNCLSETWQELASNEMVDHMINLWNHAKEYLSDFKAAGGMGGPDDAVVDKLSVSTIVSTINSDTSMERKEIQMDRHKWFVRLGEGGGGCGGGGGALDLLTGHVGGIVPEFYMSDRTLGLNNNQIPRLTFMRLHSESPLLEKTYALLTDELFFWRYLKELFDDRTDDAFDTLREMMLGEGVDVDDDDDEDEKKGNGRFVRSMLHFYTHLCKYMCFEYDMILYMLDVFASILIATNYERKFFVFKGVTCNGKSKLFELLGRTFGGYYQNIQSDNLTPSGKGGSGAATPELASTLFSCRIVTIEELAGKLDQNRVKKITGDSHVTFRNMYEPNMGGIPVAKLFTTTNTLAECRGTIAFQDRVIAVPFDATFVDRPPATTSEQVTTNTYGKDAYVVQESYVGCFLMLYYHLKGRMSRGDGLLHYREEPEYIKEYTEDYLVNTDLYVQFKVHMDVQIVLGCMTSMNDVRSAVRQFLKGIKDLSIHETELFMKFEEEFGKFRRTDVDLGTFDYTSVFDNASSSAAAAAAPFTSSLVDDDDEDEEEGDEDEKDHCHQQQQQQQQRKKLPPPAKRVKPIEKSPVLYDHVVIKNLKRQDNG